MQKKTSDDSRPTLVLMVPWMVLGGADRCGIDLLRAATDDGWRTVVLSTGANAYGNTWENEFRAVADKVVDIGSPGSPRDGTTGDEALRVLAEERPDLIVLNNSHLGYREAARIRAAIPGAAIVPMLHMELPGEWDFISRILEAPDQFDEVLAISHRMKDRLVEGGYPAHRVAVVHWSTGGRTRISVLRQRLEGRETFGLGRDDTVILFPSRLAPQKRPLLAVETLARIPDRSVKMLFGGYGRWEREVRLHAARLGVEDRIILTGGIPSADMDLAYAVASAVFLPSEDEGIPLAIYEAIGMGVPVVASKVGAVHEVLGPREAFLVDRSPAGNEAERLAGALMASLTYEGRERADRAWIRHAQEFSPSEFRARISDFLARHKGVAPPRKPRKVFCIGMAKTGTSSVGAALRRLGYRTAGFDPALQDLYFLGMRDPIWEAVERYDAFSDGPFNTGSFYEELLARYPDALFILTVREKEAWVESHRNHFAKGGSPRIPDKWKLTTYDSFLWKRFYEERNTKVIDLFRKEGKDSQLLVLRPCDGADDRTWMELCDFLGEGRLPEGTPFPRENPGTYPR